MDERMTYYSYLKKSFPFYLFSGLVFSIAIASLIVAHNFSRSLSDTLSSIESVNMNKEMVITQIKETDDLQKYLIDNFGTDMTGKSSDSLVFDALDKMKTNLKKATIRVGRFEESGGRTELPVEINAPMSSYKMIVNYLDYIESFIIPEYEIRNMSISKDQTGRVILNIRGVFALPGFEEPQRDEEEEV